MPTVHVLGALCPSCAASRAARDHVFSESFWLDAGSALLPFLIVALLMRWIVRWIDAD